MSKYKLSSNFFFYGHFHELIKVKIHFKIFLVHLMTISVFSRLFSLYFFIYYHYIFILNVGICSPPDLLKQPGCVCFLLRCCSASLRAWGWSGSLWSTELWTVLPLTANAPRSRRGRGWPQRYFRGSHRHDMHCRKCFLRLQCSYSNNLNNLYTRALALVIDVFFSF